jgi:hypothetical protein
MTDSLLLKRPAAAKLLGISLKLFDRQVARGDVAFVLIGKQKRFTQADLYEFIERKKQCLSLIAAGTGTRKLPTSLGKSWGEQRVVRLEQRRIAKKRNESTKND